MAVEFFAFFIATLNFRFCAKGWVKATLATDLILAANFFIVIRLVADTATTPVDMVGYVIGAGLGSLAAMRLTRGMANGE